MTKEEAIQELELIKVIGTDRLIEVLDIAIDAIKESDSYRYRWHDLRKNPCDLPDSYRRVLVCAEEEELNRTSYSTDWFTGGEWEYFSDEFETEYWRLIAWRDIEEFEEG